MLSNDGLESDAATTNWGKRLQPCPVMRVTVNHTVGMNQGEGFHSKQALILMRCLLKDM
jgi:hypothetical protein